MKGYNASFDSFQSTNLPLFPGGVWNATDRMDHGDISTLSTNSSALVLQNCQVRGSLRTPPNWMATGAAIGSGGSVGDNAWVGGGFTGIEAGHAQNNAVEVYADASLPSGRIFLPAPPTSVVINGVTYQYVLNDSNPWIINNLNGSIYVDGTNVLLELTGTSARVPSGGAITVPNLTDANGNPYGLAVYVAATSFTVNGPGFVNASGIAKNLKYYGLPSNTFLTLGGNASSTAQIYAPEADFNLGGGGNNTYDFSGAIITKSFTLNGHFNIHGDEALSAFPPTITQPQSQTVLAGQNIACLVSATGQSPLTYRWYFNQTNLITGETNYSLVLSNVTTGQSGSYSVTVSNYYGSITSSPATLLVYTSTVPALSFPGFTSNNQLQLSITGVTGFNYAVEASTNLSDWASLTTNVSPFIFVDTDAGNFAQRFYRAVYLP